MLQYLKPMSIESFLLNMMINYGPVTDPKELPVGTIRLGQNRRIYIVKLINNRKVWVPFQRIFR